MSDPRRAFKVAFLGRCAAAGLDPLAAAEWACKTALLDLPGKAVDAVSHVGGRVVDNLAGWGLPLAVGGPVVVGGLGGYLAAQVRNAEPADPEEVKRQELLEVLRRETDAVRARAEALRSRAGRKPAGRPIL